jgi:hypothetical protein
MLRWCSPVSCAKLWLPEMAALGHPAIRVNPIKGELKLADVIGDYAHNPIRSVVGEMGISRS